ncbi:MAG: L,D-transpeptidase [Candidatus Thermochlorobacter sp.]
MLQIFLVLLLFSQLRPNLCDSLQERPTRHILIKKSEFRLYLYNGSALEASYPIAIGKNAGDKQAVGDMRTPEGKFYISQIQDSRHWTHDFKDGKGEIAGAYGPWFLRLHTSKERTKSGKNGKASGFTAHTMRVLLARVQLKAAFG